MEVPVCTAICGVTAEVAGGAVTVFMLECPSL